MVSLAVAAVLLGGVSSPVAYRQTPSYVLPLYDLVNHSRYDGMTTTVDSYLMVSGPLPPNNPFGKFRAFYQAGGPRGIMPNGNWIEVTNSGSWQAAGNEIHFTWTNNSYVRGTVWIQYAGGPGDSINGTETSIVACEVNDLPSSGHGSRPGALVPIVDVVPGTDVQGNNLIPVSFNLYTPFGGMWGNSAPSFFETTGQNPSPAPGNGWTWMTNQNLAANHGTKQVTALAHPNASSGYYIASVQETYTPSESYNTHSWSISEFSGVMRAYTIGQ